MNLGWRELWLLRILPVGLMLFAFPVAAHAHTPIKGMGEFASGLLHPLTTPSHVLILLGLGLMLGQRSPLSLKPPMLVFIPVSGLALALTTMGWVKTIYPPILVCIALCAATLVALEKCPSPFAMAALLAVAALAIGLDSAVEAGSAAVVVKTLLGNWVCLIVVLCDVAIYVSYCTQKKWLQVGVRVLGSWIIAISLLVLAFSFRK